jgi:hypothetical protein
MIWIINFLLLFKLTSNTWGCWVEGIFEFINYLNLAGSQRFCIEVIWTFSSCMVRKARLFGSNDLACCLLLPLILLLLFKHRSFMTLGPKLDLLRHGPPLNEVFSWPMLLVIVFISIFFNWVHNACVVFLGTQILIALVPLIMNTWNRHLFI